MAAKSRTRATGEATEVRVVPFAPAIKGVSKGGQITYQERLADGMTLVLYAPEGVATDSVRAAVEFTGRLVKVSGGKAPAKAAGDAAELLA